MTSLSTPGQLQNAIKFCTKVRKTGSADRVELFNTESPITGYHVPSYFWSAFVEVRKKTAENAASDGFGSNFRGAAFCLA